MPVKIASLFNYYCYPVKKRISECSETLAHYKSIITIIIVNIIGVIFFLINLVEILLVLANHNSKKKSASSENGINV